MFKYLLLKTIYAFSDVDVVERSQYDMSFKYFLDMNPEDDVINPSSLTKFRKLRLKDTDLLNLLINKTVTIAIEKGIIRSKSIIVDATHTLSRSNPFLAIDVLRERSKISAFIPLEKDQSYIFELRAQALGSLLDGSLAIRDLSGKELATNDDSGRHSSPDPVLTWKAPSTEPHFIVVGDIRRHGGKQFHYELQVIQATPSAKLTVSQDRWSVNQGATVEVKVAVARQHGHDQAITLSVQGLPEGLSCRFGDGRVG